MNHELVSRAISGDLTAFEDLIEEHQDRWIRLALSVLSNREDALDAFQEGLIQLHRSLKTFRREASFTTWSARVMMNTYLRQRRQRSRKRERESVASDIPNFAENIGLNLADKDLMIQEQREALRSAIGCLPEKQQMVVALRYDGEMSLKEIAEAMGCGLGTVKRYLYRAMEKLRKDLKKYFR
jgi:RNA polymerase sigma-70 factor (ECF subfamily)